MNEYDRNVEPLLPLDYEPRGEKHRALSFIGGFVSGTVASIGCMVLGFALASVAQEAAVLFVLLGPVVGISGLIVWSALAKKQERRAFARGLFAALIFLFCILGLLVGTCFYALSKI